MHRTDQLPVLYSETYVLEILEVRDVDGSAAGGSMGGAYFPSWSVALARAESFDRFHERGERKFHWDAIWRIARDDKEWQAATATVAVLDEHRDVDGRFLRQWVNTWLAKKAAPGVRCYPDDMVEGAVLTRINLPGSSR